MNTGKMRIMFFSSAAVAALAPWAPALAQQAEPATPTETPATGPIEAVEPDASVGDESIVVTGSRIRRARTDSAAPVIAIDQQSLTDRGFVTAADALNQVTSIAPALSLSTGAGVSPGSGQQFPNLFGLGAGRTLTLVNGRRFVTSSTGLGDSQVDANIIPTGLIQRVEIVQAGGAVVYGSDAIAGVVNYILRSDFEGLEIDGQAGISSRGDYPLYSARVTAGQNFAGGRGNIAANIEWSQSDTLAYADRARSNLSRVNANNPANTGPADGISSILGIIDGRFTAFNNNGIIFTIPAPVPQAPCGNQICFLRNAFGQPLQFTSDGRLTTYDPGELFNVPFSRGGQGFRFADLSNLRSGVQRLTSNVIGHFDLSDAITIRTELSFARTEGEEQPQFATRTVLNNAASGAGVISFTRTNGFLTPETVAQLSLLRPQFATGSPLFLSKSFPDLQQEIAVRTTTDSYRALLALEGEFQIGARNFYWSLSGSYARVEGSSSGYGIVNTRYANAINSVRLADGTVVCAINADANPNNNDPACAPINPFGLGNVSQAARDYINVRTGSGYTNEQIDLLATIGGELFDLPGGTLRFSGAYEHRDESVSFAPFLANQLGLTGTGARSLPQSGGYDTDELSGELLVPLVGGDFTLPLVRELELNLAGRFVDNSLAGQETLWSVGGRWQVFEGLTLRASRSHNFRAPTLAQTVAPTNVVIDSAGLDACDADRISQGPNPAARRRNCLAAFQANPGYGVGPNGVPAGSSAEARLAAFQSASENFQIASITVGGNRDLRNEISDTLTFGFVFQPRFIPGLTITVDRVEVDLTDGLSAFTTADFVAACYDNDDPPPGVCEAFTRLAVTDGSSVGGTVVAGRTTTFNAGLIEYRGEVFNISYLVPLQSIFSGDPGTLELALEATHTDSLRTSVTGATFVKLENTTSQPDWVGRFDLRYARGPFRFTYQVVYRDAVLAGPDATVENSPVPFIDSNVLHNMSVQVQVDRSFTLRAGLLNLFDTEPSFPTISYGDIIGRQFYVGARVRF